MSAPLTFHLAAPTGEAAKSGPMGLLVILVLVIACYFLFRSMTKHLRRVRDDFPNRENTPKPPPAGQRPNAPGSGGPANDAGNASGNGSRSGSGNGSGSGSSSGSGSGPGSGSSSAPRGREPSAP